LEKIAQKIVEDAAKTLSAVTNQVEEKAQDTKKGKKSKSN